MNLNDHAVGFPYAVAAALAAARPFDAGDAIQPAAQVFVTELRVATLGITR
jgi:hypothetical protein